MEKRLSETPSLREKEFVNALTQNHITFSVYKHEKVITLQDVQSQLPFNTTRLVKTLVFKADGTWVLDTNVLTNLVVLKGNTTRLVKTLVFKADGTWV